MTKVHNTYLIESNNVLVIEYDNGDIFKIYRSGEVLTNCNKKEVYTMSMFSNLNKSYENKFIHMPEGLDVYKALKDLNADDVYTVLGMYIVPASKSKFGEHANMVIVGNEGEPFITNLPHHMTESVKMILADDRLIEGVNNGDCKVRVKDYFSKKYNKNCRTLEFC